MKNDPRDRNIWCDTSSVSSYLTEYAQRLRNVLLSIDPVALERARELIQAAATSDKTIYSIGNGGSAAIADHLCCDWTKGTHVESHPTVRTQSLCSNVSLYSAVANDFGFEKVFSAQVEFLCRPGDLLVAISSSGNSPNIIAAVQAAKALGVATIGLSGFSGGRLAAVADVSLFVSCENYGIVEDAHQALMHVLAQYIARVREVVD